MMIEMKLVLHDTEEMIIVERAVALITERRQAEWTRYVEQGQAQAQEVEQGRGLELRQWLAQEQVQEQEQEQVQEQEAPKKAKRPRKAKAEPQPEPQPEPSAAVSLDDVKDTISELLKAQGAPAVHALLNEFGVARAGDLSENQYAAFVTSGRSKLV